MPGTALIVRVPGDERIYIPLRAELGSYRFRVIELPDRPGRRNEALSELAGARDAQAALRARPDSMSVELWVLGVTSDSGADSEELVNAGPGRSPDMLALRVTEAMRARGLKLSQPTAAASARPASEPAVPTRPTQPTPEPAVSAPSPAPGAPTAPKPSAASPATPAQPAPTPAASPTPAKVEVAATPAKPPQAPAPSAPKPPTPKAVAEKQEQENAPDASADSSDAPELPARRPLLFVEAAPLGVLGTNGNSLAPGLDALVQARLQPYPSSSVSLFGFIPLWQAAFEGEQGRAEVRAWAIGGFADLHVPLQAIELSAGLGGGSLLVSVTGTSNSTYPGNSSPQRIAAFFGRVGMSVSLTRDLRLSARVMAGITVPELRIEFGRDTVATWGRMLVLGSLGLELALPWER